MPHSLVVQVCMVHPEPNACQTPELAGKRVAGSALGQMGTFCEHHRAAASFARMQNTAAKAVSTWDSFPYL